MHPHWAATPAWKLSALFALVLCPSGNLHSHPADLSHLRVKVVPQSVELRFSLNVSTMERIGKVDADGDKVVTAAELDAFLPQATDFLRRTVSFSINAHDPKPLTLVSHEYVWPKPQETRIDAGNASAFYVDFTFVQPAAPIVEDVWLGFEWFTDLGQAHVTQAIFSQQGRHDEAVDFTVAEPEYLWDTGWTPEDIPPAAPRQWVWAAGGGVVVAGLLAVWFMARLGPAKLV